MKSLLVRCYPAAWQARYGDEFRMLLDERPLGPYDVVDVLLGALDARLRSRRSGAAGTSQGRGLPMSLRLGGIAAIFGSAIFTFVVVATLSGAFALDPRILIASFLIGLVLLLIALTILSAFQARTFAGLVWTAFGLAAFGVTAWVFGLLGLLAISEGSIPAGGTVQTLADAGFAVGGLAAVVGFALFGVATFRSAELSRAGAVLLACGPGLMAVAWVGAFVVSWDIGAGLMLAGLTNFFVGWLLLGIAAIRMDDHMPAVRVP
jgi:hypothetical protein